MLRTGGEIVSRSGAATLPRDGAAAAADSAGVIGAVLAALCCAGTPIIVGGVTALGLGFLRNDAILWPLMLVSLVIATWGFWRGRQCHGHVGPLLLGGAGAISMASGVIFVHGFPAMQMIYAGAAALLSAMIWNTVLRRSRR